MLIKWGGLQRTWVQKVKILPSYENFCHDPILSKITEIFQTALKFKILT